MEFQIEWLERTPSTNTYLKDQLTELPTLGNGSVLATREQTAGRGRSNRKWETAPDTNLCFSIFLETTCPLIDIPSSTMATALGISDFLHSRKIFSSPKWPNDVLVNGKKICGILSERFESNTKRGIIVGIGLNVNMTSAEAEAIDRPATSMLIESATASDLFQTLETLLPHLDYWLEQWKAGGFSNLRKPWTEKAGPIGKPIKVHDGDLYKEGSLAGFGDHGELLLQTSQGLETIWSGDVS